MKKLSGCFGALAVLIMAGGEAAAQQCIPVPAGETVADVMIRDFGEHFVWRGQMKEGPVLELYFNPEKRTWTQFFIVPERDMVCFAASGEMGEFYPIPRKDGA